MNEILARTFVIVFLLAYGILFVALVGWVLRNLLSATVKTWLHETFFDRLCHLHFLHDPRNAH